MTAPLPSPLAALKTLSSDAPRMTCKRCNEPRKPSQFRACYTRPNGKTWRRRICVFCQARASMVRYNTIPGVYPWGIAA